MPKARPDHEIRLGRVKAAIWRNETEGGIRHNVTFSRIYKGEKGWESATFFGRDELPLVAKVADLAHTWIFENGGGAPEEGESRPKANGKASHVDAKY